MSTKTTHRIMAAFAAMAMALPAYSIIAKWQVKPEYDKIQPAGHGALKVTKGGKSGLIDMQARSIVGIDYDSISDFREDRAILYKDNILHGIVTPDGKVIDLSEKNYEVSEAAPYYLEGFLLVKRNGRAYFLDKEGKEAYGPFADAFPFSEGHARVTAYTNLTKDPSKTHFDLINTKGESFTLRKEKKTDIDFLSSVHAGQAIVVINKKYFRLSDDTYEILPLSVDGSLNKKSLVVSDTKDILLASDDDGYKVVAKNGQFFFDPMLRLKSMELEGADPKNYAFKTAAVQKPATAFEVIEADGLFGLKTEEGEVLPPQFEEVGHCEGDLATVKSEGRWGMIILDRKNDFIVKLNNNEPIGFAHQYNTAGLTAMMPAYVKSTTASVKSMNPDCEIMIESRTDKENVEGSIITYDCRMTIPSDLTSELTEHKYSFSIGYDGLTSAPVEVKVPEWHIKAYEVVFPEDVFEVDAPCDSVTVEFEVKKSEPAGDGAVNYFKNIEAWAPTLAKAPTLMKITENHFFLRITSIVGDRAIFVIKVSEAGCPVVEYPFELTFTPIEKSKKLKAVVSPLH